MRPHSAPASPDPSRKRKAARALFRVLGIHAVRKAARALSLKLSARYRSLVRFALESLEGESPGRLALVIRLQERKQADLLLREGSGGAGRAWKSPAGRDVRRGLPLRTSLFLCAAKFVVFEERR